MAINLFQIGETVICSITVKDSDGNLKNPTTSTNIVINRIEPSYLQVVASTAMDNDGVGLYHYDYDSTISSAGTYKIIYTATDGERITVQKDKFTLEIA